MTPLAYAHFPHQGRVLDPTAEHYATEIDLLAGDLQALANNRQAHTAQYAQIRGALVAFQRVARMRSWMADKIEHATELSRSTIIVDGSDRPK